MIKKLTGEQIQFLDCFANIIHNNETTWYYIPMYFKRTEGSFFETVPIDQLPEDIKNLIRDIRNESFCACDNPNGFKEMEKGVEFCTKCKKPY